MAEHGYHGASIAKIAKKAGLASGLILYHFESKADILNAAIENLVALFEARYAKRLESAGTDPRDQINAFVDAHLSLFPSSDKKSVAAWVIIGAQAVQNAEVRKLYAASIEKRTQELEQLIRAERKSRGKSSRGAKQSAAAIMSSIEGAFLLSSAAPGVFPKGYAAPTLQTMIEALLEE
jgi:TetR/AcrR family transcriptional repressor of bet genes